MTIAPPRHPRRHPDRFNECQVAIEDKMIELLINAKASGWDEDEVLAAMIEVADNTSLALHASMRLRIARALINLLKKNDV